ncbi:ribonuclease E inhibitor RraB [Lutimonas sp.]|uniref:ribonuclease E inhibitor RraB n=1 Tax=Lutimonas sp. TaxID=1872403 RepID=UPI003D9B982E
MSSLSPKKKLFYSLGLLCYVFSAPSLFGQDDWIDYVTMKEKGVMSISIDLSLDLVKPNYKNMLIVGGQFQDCYKNGFPHKEALESLFAFSDSTAATINKITDNRLTAFMTYQCMGFDVFYVKDTVGLRTALTKMLEANFPANRPYVKISRDKSWGYYRNYLYPRDFSAEYLIDHDYLHDLVLQGDDLLGQRKVYHWLYFKNVEKRNLFGKKMKNLNFSLDSIAYRKNNTLPYQLTISRQDSIDPLNVYKLTSMLRGLSGSMNGQYDGWSTEVILKE